MADTGANAWQKVKKPAPGLPQSIGDYSAGCIQGAQSLALDGEGYQVMHPSRRRYFGHPYLVRFIQDLGRAVHTKGLGVILVGDLSLPRGGRATGGHASHQSGLDVDLWYWHPKRAELGPLSQDERERTKAQSVLDSKTSTVKAKWSAYVIQMLRFTAEYPRVERVFVHPAIKRELCAQPFKQRAWMKKIRPWHGHDDHAHVRLACPEDSLECTRQAPVPEGDGCQELDWWFNDTSSADREIALKAYVSKVLREPKLPARCYQLLESAEPEGEKLKSGSETVAPLGQMSIESSGGVNTSLAPAKIDKNDSPNESHFGR